MQYDRKLPQYFKPRNNRVFTAVIYHGKLPWYFYNIGPWMNLVNFTGNTNSISLIFCRIFRPFGNPALAKLEFRLYPPLSSLTTWSHNQDHYLCSLPHYRFRIRSNQIHCTMDVYIKASFGTKIYLYIFGILQISRV